MKHSRAKDVSNFPKAFPSKEKSGLSRHSSWGNDDDDDDDDDDTISIPHPNNRNNLGQTIPKHSHFQTLTAEQQSYLNSGVESISDVRVTHSTHTHTHKHKYSHRNLTMRDE